LFCGELDWDAGRKLQVAGLGRGRKSELGGPTD
jgi:hypothetical protein